MIKDWLDGLSPRERLMVIGCGVVIVLALIWVLGIQPLIKQSTGLQERVQNKRAQLTALHELAGQLPAGGSAATFSSEDSIVVVIDRTTREKQLATYLKRNQPEDDSRSVRLRFEGAPFDALVSWLGELSDRYAMTVTNASFDGADAGRVNASLVIRRAGA